MRFAEPISKNDARNNLDNQRSTPNVLCGTNLRKTVARKNLDRQRSNTETCFATNFQKNCCAQKFGTSTLWSSSACTIKIFIRCTLHFLWDTYSLVVLDSHDHGLHPWREFPSVGHVFPGCTRLPRPRSSSVARTVVGLSFCGTRIPWSYSTPTTIPQPRSSSVARTVVGLSLCGTRIPWSYSTPTTTVFIRGVTTKLIAILSATTGHGKPVVMSRKAA